MLGSTDERTDGWLRARTLLLLGSGDVGAQMVVRSRLRMMAGGAGAGGVQGRRLLLRRELLVGRGADDVG